jgi:AcrR family transcriptional regulator
MKPARRRRKKTEPTEGHAAEAQRPNLLRGEHLPPSPSQNRSRAKREALMRAALELFARDGFEATSIEGIAKRATTAVGGFYQHFRSKRQLLLVLMNDLIVKLERVDMQPQATDLRSAIEAVLSAGLATDLAYAGAYRAWREASLSDKRLAALDAQVRAWTASRLSAVFIALQRLPNARHGFDASLFAGVMDRLFWELLGTNLATDSRLVATLAHIIYHSLLVDDSKN